MVRWATETGSGVGGRVEIPRAGLANIRSSSSARGLERAGWTSQTGGAGDVAARRTLKGLGERGRKEKGKEKKERERHAEEWAGRWERGKREEGVLF